MARARRSTRTAGWTDGCAMGRQAIHRFRPRHRSDRRASPSRTPQGLRASRSRGLGRTGDCRASRPRRHQAVPRDVMDPAEELRTDDVAGLPLQEPAGRRRAARHRRAPAGVASPRDSASCPCAQQARRAGQRAGDRPGPGRRTEEQPLEIIGGFPSLLEQVDQTGPGHDR